jgi:hypothetical protein
MTTAVQSDRTDDDGEVGARSLPAQLGAAALGAWLAASTFLWPHARAEMYTNIFLGLAIALTGVLAWAFLPALRWGNVLLAPVLFLVSVLTHHEDGGTVLNQIAVSLMVLALCFVPAPTDDQIQDSWSSLPNPDV